MTTTSSVYRKVVLGMLVFTTMCAVGTRGVLAAADDEERERVEEAAQVLRELARADDAEAIPEELFERAKAIAVVPGVVRGAFVIGGRWGKGVVVSRNASGDWGPASFLELSGASVGFQIGGDKTDLVMVFVNDEGLDALLESRVELGADASVAAGPVGRTVEIGTDASLDAEIFAYSRSKGAFAGAALDGTVINVDDSANEDAFGREIDGDAALDGSVATPAVFEPLVAVVRSVTSGQVPTAE
jgi:lipid-binding SYLF domain-containing protein